MTAVPVVVIGGWLGSGKTTLVNHLLRHAGGRRIAVLVNDFGESSIDADLIEGAHGSVLALAGGCVCCSFGADLVGTLVQAAAQRPDVVLVETSGVGLPHAVARTARLAAGVHVDGIVVVADARTVRAQSADAYVGDVVRQQLADADLLLLNKADGVAADTLAALEAWLGDSAPVVAAEHGRVDADVVLGVRALPEDAPFTPRGPIAPAAQRFESSQRLIAGPTDVQALAKQLAAQPDLLRAKGLLLDREGRPQVLHVVGRRWSVEPARDDRGVGRLVVVTLRSPATARRTGPAA